MAELGLTYSYGTLVLMVGTHRLGGTGNGKPHARRRQTHKLTNRRKGDRSKTQISASLNYSRVYHLMARWLAHLR
jgi:hypothetical protein